MWFWTIPFVTWWNDRQKESVLGRKFSSDSLRGLFQEEPCVCVCVCVSHYQRGVTLDARDDWMDGEVCVCARVKPPPPPPAAEISSTCGSGCVLVTLTLVQTQHAHTHTTHTHTGWNIYVKLNKVFYDILKWFSYNHLLIIYLINKYKGINVHLIHY